MSGDVKEIRKELLEEFSGKSTDELLDYMAKLKTGCIFASKIHHLTESEGRWINYCMWTGSEKEWLKHCDKTDFSIYMGPEAFAKREFLYKRSVLLEKQRELTGGLGSNRRPTPSNIGFI